MRHTLMFPVRFLSDPRYWFHASADQRYVRYMNGPADRAEQDLREVGLPLNGEVRTGHTPPTVLLLRVRLAAG